MFINAANDNRFMRMTQYLFATHETSKCTIWNRRKGDNFWADDKMDLRSNKHTTHIEIYKQPTSNAVTILPSIDLIMFEWKAHFVSLSLFVCDAHRCVTHSRSYILWQSPVNLILRFVAGFHPSALSYSLPKRYSLAACRNFFSPNTLKLNQTYRWHNTNGRKP